MIRYIRGRQTPEGGFSFYRSWGVEEPSPADTYYALAALSLLGGEPLDRDGCLRWLQSRQDAGGNFPGLIAAWQVLRALDTLGALPAGAVTSWLRPRSDILFEAAAPPIEQPTGELLAELARFVDLWLLTGHKLEPRQRTAVAANLERLRDPQGAFSTQQPNLVDTAVALRLTQMADLIPDRRLLDFARACEDPLYGFRAGSHGRSMQLEILAAGLNVLAAFDAAPRYEDALRRTLAACQHANGGFSRQPGALPTLRDTWFAARILERLGGTVGTTATLSESY